MEGIVIVVIPKWASIVLPALMLHGASLLPMKGGAKMDLTLQSSAFSHGGEIPWKHTCDGPDLSPGLRWNDPPARTQTFSLIVDDPDAPAGTWVHWVLYDLPGSLRELSEGLPKTPDLANGSHHGRNDFGKFGYGGPCPPRGPAHRYFFKLYALDTTLNLKAGATKAELEKAMKGHVLAQAELMGKYKR
jgi:Raf kinase inhibitor-like YbhB/YbcL family protein